MSIPPSGNFNSNLGTEIQNSNVIKNGITHTRTNSNLSHNKNNSNYITNSNNTNSNNNCNNPYNICDTNSDYPNNSNTNNLNNYTNTVKTVSDSNINTNSSHIAQKRQNLLSNYMIANAAKRTANPQTKMQTSDFQQQQQISMNSGRVNQIQHQLHNQNQSQNQNQFDESEELGMAQQTSANPAEHCVADVVAPNASDADFARHHQLQQNLRNLQQSLQGQLNQQNQQSQSQQYSPGSRLVSGALPNNSSNTNRNSVRRNLLQQQQHSTASMKTPTPSAYEVPLSPNINQMSHISVQNHSDLSESNPVMDRSSGINQSVVETSEIKDSVHLKSFKLDLNQNQNQNQVDNSPPSQQSQRTMSDEEQQLATKLKETYKNIVNFEEIVQKNCIEITIKINQITSNNNNNSLVYGNAPLINQQPSNSLTSSTSIASNTTRTSELLNDLWTVYHHNITLLDNYYDFLVTALKPSSNQTQFKTGKNIVELYKIPRRMWVYGIVGFLEVLKNIMSIFQDHEICLCFISYCFNIISNLTDPILEMEGWWLEKLGDLSRMAIALYASKFIDWKISAEYWYSISMKTFYGHGKIYYHMCTVQQDNLDALVNIGKSVICRDPFVPTQHYLRLVVENICTQRNILSLLELPIIDFIKIHKVLLSIHTSRSNDGLPNSVESIQGSQLQYGIDLVTRYGLTFGSDSNGYNFFTRELYTPSGVTSINDPHHPYYLQQQQQPSATNTIEKMNFWFNKGSLFAIANINHLVGFGDARNPFAKIFQLPEALKERKDKKDRKRKSRTSQTALDENPNSATISNGVDGQSITAPDLSVNDWFYCLQFVNKSVLELSIRILNHYLVGPKQASTGHVIVWLYFLIAVGEATKRFPGSTPMFGWLFTKLFPWESLINYLNSLLSFVKNNPRLSELCAEYAFQNDYIQFFNDNEFLPEVWKCWGTLWFDCIAEKGDYNDLEAAGVKNINLFDLPACGTYPVVTMPSESDQKSRNVMENENDERIIRIILLARVIADKYNFGLIRTPEEFKFDQDTYNTIDSSVPSSDVRQSDPYTYMEDFLLGDGRFVQNNFLQPISIENLYDSHLQENMSPEEKDTLWFVGYGNRMYDEENLELGEEMVDEDEVEGYADSEFEDEESEHDHKHHGSFQQHQHALQQQRQQLVSNDTFYNIMLNPDPLGMGETQEAERKSPIEGNLGDRMDTNITHITLDTNIWLKHCGRIFKCVRNLVFKILIPLIVFQELRALRKSTEATIADAATRSVIIIRELYLANEIMPLRFDGTIASDINETTEFENNSNWRSSVDETILNSVNEHDDLGKRLMKGLNLQLSPFTKRGNEDNNSYSRHTDPVFLSAKASKIFRYCILITDDRNMRLRAKTIGLISFQSRWLFNQLETLFPNECID